MKSLERFASLLEYQSVDEWQKSIFKFGSDYGFEQSLIAVSPVRPKSLDQAFLRSNYHTQWLEIYGNRQLISIDPTVAHCIARPTPLIWEPSVFASKKQKEMYEEASSHGLRSCISLPFHGAGGEVGILCFVNDGSPSKNFKRDTTHNILELSMLRDFAFESSLRYANFAKFEHAPTLTQRELGSM